VLTNQPTLHPPNWRDSLAACWVPGIRRPINMR
jgi:hypothetical protein